MVHMCTYPDDLHFAATPKTSVTFCSASKVLPSYWGYLEPSLSAVHNKTRVYNIELLTEILF